MEPDSRGPKPSEDRRRFLVESTDSRAVDALQAKLFAKALLASDFRNIPHSYPADDAVLQHDCA